MIRYALKCSQDHGFESWFQSAAAFDGLLGSGLLTCPTCGSAEVEKAIMAPPVRPARKGATDPGKAQPLSRPGSDAERDLARLKARIESESEYVGMSFAREARAIHDGDAPERPIYGEARPVDAKRLIEDGIPVAPLPFIPGRKTN